MAVDLDGNDWLNEGAAPVTAYPLTIAGWFNVTGYPAAGAEYLLTVGNTGAVDQWFGLYLTTGDTWGYIAYGGAIDLPSVASGVSTGEWHHICAVFTNATTRTGFFDGSETAGSTDSITPSGVNDLRIGNLAWNGANVPLHGLASEIGIWNVALTGGETDALANGTSPDQIRPANLIRYFRLLRDYNCWVSSTTLSTTGDPTFTAHPRIIYAMPQLWVPVPVTAAPVGQPTMKRTQGIPTGAGYRDRPARWN